MATLIVPKPDEAPFPTLGPQVCAFLQERAVFGPGDLRGQPATLDAEKRGAIYRAYEVFPQGHPRAGRRRFQRVGLSWRKGTAKTEFMAWLAYVELHPEAPVRCDGFDADGNPVGRPVSDPYIPLVAYTAEQTEELAFGALYVVTSEGPDADLFDIGLGRVMRVDGDGKAVPLSGSPNSRDGARTTFQGFDETHRMVLPRLREAHETMLGNLPKRPLADPWALETTTAFEPGAGSVAETTYDEAKLIEAGRLDNSALFYFHRYAGTGYDLDSHAARVAAVTEASGPAARWSDVESIAAQWARPGADGPYLERVWLNRTVQSARQAFDARRWRELAEPGATLADGELVTVGFDGARTRDSTGLVVVGIESGLVQQAGYWPRPAHLPDTAEWEVPEHEVNAAVAEVFERYHVWRMYGDPPYWQDALRRWSGEYGERTVVEWWTNRQRPTAYACKTLATAIESGGLSHDGDPDLAAHIGNSRRKDLRIRDEDGAPLWRIEKARPDSPHKIDLAMCLVLAWEARGDALASGALHKSRASAPVPADQIVRVR